MAIAVGAEQFLEAAPEAVGISSERLGRLSRTVQRWVDERRIPGAITMVARRGRLVHFETFGQMDKEAGKPMRPDTIFRIYSMTKPIASVALMTMYEEGKFQLDDPASKFIPEFADLQVFAGGTADSFEVRPPSRPMTVRDLLMHTSGLSSHLGNHPVCEIYRRNDVRSMRSDETIGDLTRKLGKMPLQADPGSTWIYGLSTDVVGYLCEVLSGVPFDRFLQERILEPLGMTDTSFVVPPEKLDRLAANYRFEEPSTPPYTLFDAPADSPFARPKTFLSGVGGLLSTAADYMRFAKMLANGGELDGQRILGQRTLQLMAMNHLPNGSDIASMAAPDGPSPAGDGFGLGFAVLLDPTRSQTLGTPGEFYWSGAASTQFFVSPQDDLVAIFLTQVMNAEAQGFRRYLRVLTYQALLD